MTGNTLTETLEAYFEQSEQLPTRLYLYTDIQQQHSKAAGFMLQVLPVDQQQAKADFADLVTITDTLTKDELLNLPPEQLLFRLYHQETVELFPLQAVNFVCGCSREKCQNAIISLGEDIIKEHIAEGQLDIRCEYCNQTYTFDQQDLAALLPQ